jgi:hypothetical protein
MKIKKLNLSEITKVYEIIEPFIKDGVKPNKAVEAALDSGKGKKLFYIFYDKKVEYPESIIGQYILLNQASVENNLLYFVSFMLEISYAPIS